MDAEIILEPGTKYNKRPPDLDFLQDEFKSCKHLRLSEASEIQTAENSIQEEGCAGILNLQRSEAPSRFIYYEKGHWRDFPKHLIPAFVESFVAGKSYTKFSVQNKLYLLSFEYMLQLNLHTGFARSIAWIYRSGKRSMPGKCIEQNCAGLFSKLVDEKDRQAVRALQGDAKSKSFGSCLSTVGVESSTCGSAVSVNNFPTLGNKLLNLTEDDQDFSFAREMLLSGFSLFVKDVNVVRIYKCSHSNFMGHARLQAFEIQEKITDSSRGNANVRYAWHGTSKEGIVGIVRHGFGQPRVAKNGDAFGVGVYLAPENAANISATYSDVDESGEQHILLCKVIMGRMEQVSLGSQQFHPSSEEFDSGVDDSKKPKRYIVWSTHMNTHILPLFVISFKLSTVMQEVIAAGKGVKQSFEETALFSMHSKTDSRRDRKLVTDASLSSCSHHAHTHQHGDPQKAAEQGLCEMQADSCTSPVCDEKMVASCPIRLKDGHNSTLRLNENSCANGHSSCNVPRSPWISFPELFPMLESKLEPQAMNVLHKLHMKFQVGRLPRNLFVKMIRRMLGDDFLRECIKNRSVPTVSICDTHSFCG